MYEIMFASTQSFELAFNYNIDAILAYFKGFILILFLQHFTQPCLRMFSKMHGQHCQERGESAPLFDAFRELLSCGSLPYFLCRPPIPPAAAAAAHWPLLSPTAAAHHPPFPHEASPSRCEDEMLFSVFEKPGTWP